MRVERALLAVERDDLFALGGVADDDLGAGEFLRVEGVHGLAVFEHHIVADIDDVVDRTQADGGEAALDPLGRGADLHAGDDRGGVERAIVRAGDAHAREQIGARLGGDLGGREGNLRVAELLLEPCGEFAGDAEVAEGVGAVGRNLDVEDGVAGGKHVVDRRAEGGLAGEDEQALGVLGDGELLGGAHHAGGKLAADLGLLDDEVAGEDGAGERDGHAFAGVAIGRAADDGADAAVGGADVDGADGELVGVGVFVAGEDLADDDIGELGRAGVDDLLDLEADEGDGAGDLVVGDAGEVDVVLEPGAGEFHLKIFSERAHETHEMTRKSGGLGFVSFRVFRGQ